MAEGKWVPHKAGKEFVVNDRPAGYVYYFGPRSICPPSDAYWSGVYPPDGGPSKTVSNNVTEAEAEAAVEKYWANKPPPG